MKNKNSLDAIRHSAAHLLAAAILDLYPGTKLTIGPAIESGFYYDFDFSEAKLPTSKLISDDDFTTIEKKMAELLPTWTYFSQREVTPDEAQEIYQDNPYKLELIAEIAKRGEPITLYKAGEFEDLCRGGHAENPAKEIGAFKLLSVAGAYWRGSEKNKMLTRVYGTAFPTQKELTDHLTMLEEAKKYDHKKIAKELDLIVFSELVGSGLPLYTPKGAILRNEVYNFSRYLNKKINYQETALPNMNRGELFKVSGHYDKYKDDMFHVVSNYSKEEFFLKPMNCPQHCVIYASRQRSYRELPIRFADFSVLYRDEKPGEINGLLRSRAFTQDDGHGFVREDQIGEEFDNVLQAVDEALKTYGFDYKIRLSLRDPKQKEKYLGDDAIWDRAETKIREIVEKSNIPYFEGPGEAAIYGPKLDFMAKDSLGREWQISTIQLDMIMPVRFGLEYVDADGSRQTPFMIHRAIIGSERFIAILIEHYKGAFPVWLAPVQIIFLPIADRHLAYTEKLNEELIKAGIRSEIDQKPERLQAKIRSASLQKIPFMGIIGDREVAKKEISLRGRNEEDLGTLSLSHLITRLQEKIDQKT